MKRNTLAVIACLATFGALHSACTADIQTKEAAHATSESPATNTQTLSIEGVNVQLELVSSEFNVGSAELVTWIERSIHIVAHYYGRFPTDHLRLRVLSSGGHGVQGGTTWGSPQTLIRLRVGRDVTQEELFGDWVLVHEMVHLALPDLGREHAWLEEGVSTYVEGVARVQMGNQTSAAVWNELVHSMPHGLPQAGDQGLDHTHTWGRTYWGGAMFCLLADVEIHRRTHNQFGLQDALRAVATTSGGLSTDWPIDRVMSTGDAAVGTKVLEELYAQTKDKAFTPDLAELWKNLGIDGKDDKEANLLKDAPLVDVREAIMRKR